MVKSPQVVIVTPVDGWGFQETIDGNLSSPFAAEIIEAGVFFSINVRGWRGRVAEATAKYHGMAITLTPRNTDWNGVVVLNVRNEGAVIFSGMAVTEGLDCEWLANAQRVDPERLISKN